LSGFLPQNGSSICSRCRVSLGGAGAARSFEAFGKLGVEVTHAREQREDGGDQRGDGALGEASLDEALHLGEVGVDLARDQGELALRVSKSWATG
jgi:hypothetical protein